uniref:ARAD1D12496p n=1 Tax=Blastobotrys adeninivorans TaxID=409370 RepID=A0A060T8L6_BLAAD
MDDFSAQLDAHQVPVQGGSFQEGGGGEPNLGFGVPDGMDPSSGPQAKRSSSSSSRKRSDSNSAVKTSTGRVQKAPGELLTPEEKKANHIASEKKRRQAIREGFDKITNIVPDLDPSQGRSEAIVLTKTVEFLNNLLEENNALRQLATKHNVPLSTPLPDMNDTKDK